jgi:hypothetical protein
MGQTGSQTPVSASRQEEHFRNDPKTDRFVYKCTDVKMLFHLVLFVIHAVLLLPGWELNMRCYLKEI